MYVNFDFLNVTKLKKLFLVSRATFGSFTMSLQHFRKSCFFLNANTFFCILKAIKILFCFCLVWSLLVHCDSYAGKIKMVRGGSGGWQLLVCRWQLLLVNNNVFWSKAGGHMYYKVCGANVLHTMPFLSIQTIPKFSRLNSEIRVHGALATLGSILTEGSSK